MSYFIEHGIEEARTISRFSNPDIGDFMSPTTEAFQQFQSMQDTVGSSVVLQQIMEQLVFDLNTKEEPLCASKLFLQNLETLENVNGTLF
jgi:hypothetical protein